MQALLVKPAYCQKLENKIRFCLWADPVIFQPLQYSKTQYPGPYKDILVFPESGIGLNIPFRENIALKAGIAFSIIPYTFVFNGTEMFTGQPDTAAMIFLGSEGGDYQTFYFGIPIGLQAYFGKSRRWAIEGGLKPMYVGNTAYSDTSKVLTDIDLNNIGEPLLTVVMHKTSTLNAAIYAKALYMIYLGKRHNLGVGITAQASPFTAAKGVYIYDALPQPNSGRIKLYPNYVGGSLNYYFDVKKSGKQ